MNVQEQSLQHENKVNINYNYSEVTDYYRSRNYNVAMLRIPDRYDSLIKIYENLKNRKETWGIATESLGKPLNTERSTGKT